MASNAVDFNILSRVLGYKLTGADFRPVSANLPMRVLVLCEANEANQLTLDTAQKEIRNSQQAGQLYGYGSPAHIISRILRPIAGGGLGGIPLFIAAQAKAVGAQPKILDIEPTGVATANGTHTLVIAGRTGVDGFSYDINIVVGDTQADITQKMEDAINAVLGAPVTAAADDYSTTVTTKWAGLTANELSITVNTNNTDLGITYAVSQVQAASGTPSIQDALDAMGNTWTTIVVNSYGLVTSVMNALEQFNGIAKNDIPTGRYIPTVFKPIIAVSGSTLEDPSNITDPRKDEMTLVVAPAPLSPGLSMEAAANFTALQAPITENSPHRDIAGQSYPDMPTPSAIGAMDQFLNRDAILKKGCSTVALVSGRYQIQDAVTTHHPEGENPPQYRYVRNLIGIDWNVKYTYRVKEEINVIDKTIVRDEDTVTADNTVKPKSWKQILFTTADEFVSRALITDADFMKDSIIVGIGTTNPDRFETFFRYKRTGTVRIASTDAQAGFNYGTSTQG